MKGFLIGLRDWWRRRRQKPNSPGDLLEVGDTVKVKVFVDLNKKWVEAAGEIITINGGYASVLVVFETAFLKGALRKHE